MNIPANYKVLFMQGGATLQFSCIPYNIALTSSTKAHYIQTGQWSKKAIMEAKRLGMSNITVHTPITDSTPIVIDEDASYIYYCSNETIDGIDYTFESDSSVPIVCDMSSNILTKPVDVSKFGVIFAGAQKNMGCSGVTIVIIREDLVKRSCSDLPTPIMLDYATLAKNDSLYNTPSTFAIYVCGKVMEWCLEQGGILYLEKMCSLKAELLYACIDQSKGFYKHCVQDKKYQSKVNIPFRICIAGTPDEALENLFIAEAELNQMIQLRGHRSVGGIRASFYNACPLEHVECLVTFMRSFQMKNC